MQRYVASNTFLCQNSFAGFLQVRLVQLAIINSPFGYVKLIDIQFFVQFLQ
jgi:hypothetical protein